MADDTTTSAQLGTQGGTTTITSKEATEPDAVSVGESPERSYDEEFGYLASRSTEKKDDAAPESDKDQTTDPIKGKDGETTGGEKKEDDVVPPVKDDDVPPVAAKTTTKTDDVVVGDADFKKRYTDLQSYSDRTIDGQKKEIEGLKKEVESLQATKTALDEINKDPHSFLAKFFPEVAGKLEPQKIVVDSLKKEFGAELDAYRAEEAYMEGTTSFKIRQREYELREQLQRSRLEGEFTRQRDAKEREDRLSVSKNEVMKTYGLTEEQFNKEIIGWAQAHPVDFNMIAKARYFDWHIQNAVTQAINRKNGKNSPTAPSVASVSGSDKGSDTESPGYKELKDVFGDM